MGARSRGVYAAAGVDIDVAAKAKELIAKLAESTYRPGVLSRLADLFLCGNPTQYIFMKHTNFVWNLI